MIHDRHVVDQISSGEVRARAHVVRYEDLVEDPVTQARAMYEFLNVDPDKAGAPSTKTYTSAGFDREDPNSFYRKGAIGDWKNYATDDFKSWFKECAGAALVATGYENDLNW